MQALGLWLGLCARLSAVMYCFVYVQQADHHEFARKIAFIRTELPMNYFALIIMQIMRGLDVHLAGPDRIDWWYGFVTWMPHIPYLVQDLPH